MAGKSTKRRRGMSPRMHTFVYLFVVQSLASHSANAYAAMLAGVLQDYDRLWLFTPVSYIRNRTIPKRTFLIISVLPFERFYYDPVVANIAYVIRYPKLRTSGRMHVQTANSAYALRYRILSMNGRMYASSCGTVWSACMLLDAVVLRIHACFCMRYRLVRMHVQRMKFPRTENCQQR